MKYCHQTQIVFVLVATIASTANFSAIAQDDASATPKVDVESKADADSLKDRLIAHYPFDKDFKDHSGNKNKISAAMKKGLANAISKFDGYQLAKYRGEGKEWKLVDAVNLLHPTPTDKNKEALKSLVDGTLVSKGTWEATLSQAGKQDNKEEAKDQSWRDLVAERKIGYFALLRNLRNIQEQSPETLNAALKMLTDEKLIKKSLVLPFRYLTAIEQFEGIPGSGEILVALNKALDISCNNVPTFDGKTLVVVDYSGSMGNGYDSYRFKGSVFGSILAKANGADVMIFGDHAQYVTYNPADSTLTITKGFTDLNQGYSYYKTGKYGQVGHGTNFHSIFATAKGKYDRVVIFSDTQGWIGRTNPGGSFADYKSRSGANPFIYSFDLAGYGSMQFPENRVFCLAGFSEKAFDIMKMMETDKKALINTIRKVEI